MGASRAPPAAPRPAPPKTPGTGRMSSSLKKVRKILDSTVVFLLGRDEGLALQARVVHARLQLVQQLDHVLRGHVEGDALGLGYRTLSEADRRSGMKPISIPGRGRTPFHRTALRSHLLPVSRFPPESRVRSCSKQTASPTSQRTTPHRPCYKRIGPATSPVAAFCDN